MWLIKKLGSLYVTVCMSGLLMVLLIISTSIESVYGTSLVQKIFYRAAWFDILLSFLWINIFCATILRFPFKKRHTGFLLTHCGILGLLLGALIARLFGIDGSMVLLEGETSNTIRQSGYNLKVAYPNHQERMLALKPGTYPVPLPQESFDDHSSYHQTPDHASEPEADQPSQPPNRDTVNLSVLKFLEHASEEWVVTEGDTENPTNHALRLTVRNPKIGLDRSFWLVENHPQNPHPNLGFAGPIRIMLTVRKETGHTPPTLRISKKSGEKLIAIDLTESIPDEIMLTNSELRLTGLTYYPYARVVENKLTNMPDESSPNPAVEFEISDAKGNRKHYINFARFPEFQSTHGKSPGSDFDITVSLEADYGEDYASYAGPSLTFFVSPDEQWVFQSRAPDGSLADGEAQLNTWLPLDSTGTEFLVEKRITHATVTAQIVKSPDPDRGRAAAKILLEDEKGRQPQWIIEGHENEFHTGTGDLLLSLVPRNRELPFSLHLEDFRKKDYPGTSNPAAYESDVVLHDPQEKIKISKTISMNNPLEHKGFKVLQASYIQSPRYGEASVFRVAKNPGILLIYVSSCLILVGSVIQFYGKKFGAALKKQ